MEARKKAAPASPNAITRGHRNSGYFGREACYLSGTHIARHYAAGAKSSGAGNEGQRRRGRPRRLSQLGHHCQVPISTVSGAPVSWWTSGSTRKTRTARQSVSTSPILWDLLRPCTYLVQGADKAQIGKAVRLATKVVPGTSQRVRASPIHASLMGGHNPSSKCLTPQPAPPSVSQDAVLIPPGTKDPPSGAG